MTLSNKKYFNGFSLREWEELKTNLNNRNYQDENETVNKIRRFASFHNRNLHKIAKSRFKEKAKFQLENMIDVLLIKNNNLTNLNSHLPKQLPLDPSNLNAAIYCFESLKKFNSNKAKTYSNLLNSCKNQLSEYLEKIYRINSRKKVSDNIKNKINTDNLFCIKNPQPVIILSPNRYSLYTLSTLGICIKLKIPVKAIIIKKFSLKRFKSEFNRDGMKLLKKIYRKLILKSDENPEKIFLSFKLLSSYLTNFKKDIADIAKEKKIPYIFIDDFDEAIHFSKKHKANIALFTGGGKVSANFIKIFKRGIINLHMGVLPFYKGMDVVESPLIEGKFDSIGFSSHLMDSKIDTGPIIKIYKINSIKYRSINLLRNEMSLIMPFLLIDSYLNISNAEAKPIPQIKLGRYYYFLHKDLKSLINKFLSNYQLKTEKSEIQLFIEYFKSKLDF